MQNTPNQNLKPVTYNINSDGNIEIGGCDTVKLAEKYGTPLYVYDEETIRQMCRAYKDAFANYDNIKMMFASKAFLTKAVAKILSSENFGFDMVSGGEIYTVHSAGVDLSNSLFNGNNKSFDELKMAIEAGVGRISVDNFLELSLLDNIASSLGKKVDILLRITPGIECHTHEYIQTGHLDSKFGFDLTQLDEALELICDEYKNLNLKGLHSHLGSQIFETKVYSDAVKIMSAEFRRIKDKFNIDLSEMNIGGGLGVTYTSADCPPSVNQVAAVIIESIEKYSKEYNINKPLIYIEPGRSIVCTAGVTLYTAGSSKQVPNGRKYVAVDGGMADNPRPAMYQAEYIAEIANNPNGEEKEVVTVAGRFCESGDILIKNINLPVINEGDILCVFDTGAYCYSMSSNYNRVLKPTIVLVNNSQSDIILKGETYEDLVSHDLIPERLN